MGTGTIYLLFIVSAMAIGCIIGIVIAYKRIALLKKQVNIALSPDLKTVAGKCEGEGEYGELTDPFLIDFRPNRWISYASQGNTPMVEGGVLTAPSVQGGVSAVGRIQAGEGIISNVVKVPVRPVEVLDELKVPPTIWSLQGIDQKIEMLKKKSAHIVQRYAKQEVDGLVHCLECRKKFNDEIEIEVLDGSSTVKQTISTRLYFSTYDVTSQEKISSVLDRHNLKMGDPDIFIPELPDDAVQKMDEFTSAVMAVSGKKPRYYIIAQPSDFQKKEEARDPILLGQSPFGFFYYIIGAWDAEMMYLPDL